ncbi:hypothetical protein CANMA_000337 [Candida margitis]|uniref:uncharacterized protein n=1 Tax=Candida margitis TaxID=1775924 RepID=UPI002225CE01|nr:uncharacterized protein CANMA_000337 [Candida margitis]KAI5970596.1 hypothetical protein CANMA_000337 [Candida margitis]
MFAQTPHNQFQQPLQTDGTISIQAPPQQQQQQQQQQQHQVQQFQRQLNNSQQLQGNGNGIPQQKSNKTPAQQLLRQSNSNPVHQMEINNDNVPNTSRPGLQRNTNYNGSTASLQSVPMNAQNLQPNGAILNGMPVPATRTVSQQVPPAQTSSGSNSQGHTPAMGNTSSPVINQSNNQKASGKDAASSRTLNQQQGNQAKVKQTPGGIMFQQPGPQAPFQPQFNSGGGDGNSAFVSASQRQFPQGQGQQQQQPVLTSTEQMQQEFNARIIKRNLGNAATMRVLDLIDFLSNEAHDNLRSVEFWQRITPAYFLPNSTLRLNFSKSITSEFDRTLSEVTGLNFGFLKLAGKGVNDSSPANHFELNTTTAPRFFSQCVANSEFSRFSIFLPGMKFQVLNNGSIIIVSKLEINLMYEDNSISKLNGNVKVLMSRDLRIEWIDVNCITYESLINLNFLSKSPMKSKSVNDVYRDSQTVYNTSTFGLGKSNTRHLQLADILTHMKQLMDFSQLNNIKSPQRALELLLTTPQATIPTNFQMARGTFVNGFGAQPQQQQSLQFQNQMASARNNFQSSSTTMQGKSPLPSQQQLQNPQAQNMNPNSQQQQQRNTTNNSAIKKEADVSSPSPKTVPDDEPKKRRKPSVGGSSLNTGANKKRK